jgi:NADH-quinone oxidoreductase subunit N
LAIGSKAAGFVLLLRVLFTALPGVVTTAGWADFLIVLSGLTILYGNLCALPQHNIKRLFGYSSIAHAGYLLLGVAALNSNGQAAILYYLAGYLFTVLGAFLVIALVLRQLDTEEISGLAGLGQRSPLLAATLTISLVSLAGIPPLAGFFGKFLLLKAVVEAGQATGNHGYYCLVFTALAGVVISMYYYFSVIRTMYWSRETKDLSAIELSAPAMVTAWICIGGMFAIGLFPNSLLALANAAAGALKI